MSRTYSWTSESSPEQTREVFDALDAVDDLSTLEDVEVMIEYSHLRGTFFELARHPIGEVSTANRDWAVRHADGSVSAYITSLRFTVPDPKPTQPRGIELAEKVRECVAEGCAAHPLPDDWAEHVAIIPKLTKDELLALEEEPEGFEVAWIDASGCLCWLPSCRELREEIEDLGFRGAFLLPKVDQ